MGIGTRIREIRRRANLNQDVIANACGITRQAVSKWERETQSPEKDKLPIIAEALGVSMDELTGVTFYPGTGNDSNALVTLITPVPLSALYKKDSIWTTAQPKQKMYPPIPIDKGAFEGIPLAVIVPDNTLTSMKIHEGAVVIVDKGVEKFRNGSISLVTRYDILKIAKVVRTPSEIILTTDEGRESVPLKEEEDKLFEIIGPVKETRNWF